MAKRKVECFVENYLLKKWKLEVCRKLRGEILEIGIDDCKIVSYFPRSAKITAIDTNDLMLAQVRKHASKNKHQVHAYHMSPDHLLFTAQSFKYVMGIFLFGQSTNPVKLFKEIKRVTKKNGKIIIIEHVKSKYQLIALVQQILRPFIQLFFGVEIIPNIKDEVKKAGLEITCERSICLADCIREFTCEK